MCIGILAVFYYWLRLTRRLTIPMWLANRQVSLLANFNLWWQKKTALMKVGCAFWSRVRIRLKRGRNCDIIKAWALFLRTCHTLSTTMRSFLSSSTTAIMVRACLLAWHATENPTTKKIDVGRRCCQLQTTEVDGQPSEQRRLSK